MSRSDSPDRKSRKLDQDPRREVEFARLYQYDQLEGHDDIRLVSLLPGPFESSVQVEFIVCDLEDPPDYEALSYTWADSNGDQSLNGSVWCDSGDRRILVTRNCEAALRRLRLPNETRYLWVDAISINQSAIQERNRQVAMMPKIYHSASRVMVYLGEGTAETDEFLDFLNHRRLQGQTTLEEFIPLSYSILSRRWFKRLWILQEIALARGANIICGNKITRWQKLAQYYQQVFSDASRLCYFPHINVVFEYSLKGVRPMDTLPKLFIRTYRQSCSDPRDRVFALLGIVAKDHSLGMAPEYGASNERIFTNLAIHFLQKFNVLFIDRHVTLTLDSWPSWVFDWSQLRTRPNYPLTIDNVVSVYGSEDGVNILEILGRKVLHGTVCDGNLLRGPTQEFWRPIITEGGVLVEKGVLRSKDGIVQGVIVVEVSQDFFVVLLQKGDQYALVGGVSDFERCREPYPKDGKWKDRWRRNWEKAHTGPGQCTSTCSKPHLQLGDPESFVIV